jgi:hypothetical protein
VIFIQIIWIILGCFIDWIGILLLTAPIFIPVGGRAGHGSGVDGRAVLHEHADLVHSPPFGPAAFYLKGRHASPASRLSDIFRSIWPYMGLQIVALAGHRISAGSRYGCRARCRHKGGCKAADPFLATLFNRLIGSIYATLRSMPSSMSCECRRPRSNGRGAACRGLDSARDEACEILIAGGGTGGVAACAAAGASRAAGGVARGDDWLGGQMTAQGVSRPPTSMSTSKRSAARRVIPVARNDPRALSARCERGREPSRFQSGCMLGHAPRVRAARGRLACSS